MADDPKISGGSTPSPASKSAARGLRQLTPAEIEALKQDLETSLAEAMRRMQAADGDELARTRSLTPTEIEARQQDRNDSYARMVRLMGAADEPPDGAS